MVESRRGKNGGYCLAKPPSNVTLASVVSLSEGSLSLVPNSRSPAGQSTAAEVQYSLNEVWADINDYIAAKLQKVTLQDLCDRVTELSGVQNTQYII